MHRSRLRVISVVVASLLLAGCTESSTTEGDGGPTTPPRTTGTTATTGPAGPTAPPTDEPIPMTKVPDVEGMRLSNARTALKRAGLDPEADERYSKATEGTVLNQNPGRGHSVEEGTLVSLTVAKSFPHIPSVVRMTDKQAERTLRNAGFSWDIMRREYKASVSKDHVISQLPSGGTEARPGRLVRLVVSKGPKPPPDDNCTPGYSPCLREGPSDYDCYGGSGNGPAYTAPGVTYRVTGYDPYGLDADNDGWGCE
jgi:resuscitation-promoting factor RpfB